MTPGSMFAAVFAGIVALGYIISCLFGIVQGTISQGATCNKDLPVYMIVNGTIPLFTICTVIFMIVFIDKSPSSQHSAFYKQVYRDKAHWSMHCPILPELVETMPQHNPPPKPTPLRGAQTFRGRHKRMKEYALWLPSQSRTERRIDPSYWKICLYSPLPKGVNSIPMWVWYTGFGLGATALVSFLATIGFVIFLTVMVSQSGFKHCDPTIYKSALAHLIMNWATPPICAGFIWLMSFLEDLSR